MADSFQASVDDWVRETEARMVGVFHESAKGAYREMSRPKSEGGNLPVVSGNLRRSLAASTIGPPAVLWRQKGFKGTAAAVAAVIDSAKVGQTIWLGFQAPYAKIVEKKAAFYRLTAQRWPQIVDEAVKVVKGRT